MKFEYETDRLKLRILDESSASQVLDFYLNNQGDFEKYEPIIASNFYTLEHQSNMLSFEHKAILQLSMVRFFIYEKRNSDRIIGTVSFRNIVKSPVFSCCEVGYKMDMDYRNKGYMHEVLVAAIDIIASELGIHRIEAIVLPDNDTSIHLLESLGFEREGLLRDKVMLQGQWRDHYLYSLLTTNNH